MNSPSPPTSAPRRRRHGAAAAIAMRVVTAAARMLGATRLVPIESAHVDGCLYHGDSGVAFAEKLVAEGGRVAVRTTLNVGALDLLDAGGRQARRARGGDGAPADGRACRARLHAELDLRALPGRPPPDAGTHVAWGESNAIAFVNSVLGARSDRYGDFLDVCCALAGRAPEAGLHRDENRRATILVDAAGLPRALVADEAFWPVLGAWLGRERRHARSPRSTACRATSTRTGSRRLAPRRPRAARSGCSTSSAARPRRRRGRPRSAASRRARRSSAHAGDAGSRGGCAVDARRAVGDRDRRGRDRQPASVVGRTRPAGRAARRTARRDAVLRLHRSPRAGRRAATAARNALAAAGVTVVADTCVVVTPVMENAPGW